MKHFFWIVGVLALGLLAGSHMVMGAVDTGDQPPFIVTIGDL